METPDSQMLTHAVSTVRNIYKGAPVLFTVALVAFAVFGVYYGYAVMGPYLFGRTR